MYVYVWPSCGVTYKPSAHARRDVMQKKTVRQKEAVAGPVVKTSRRRDQEGSNHSPGVAPQAAAKEERSPRETSAQKRKPRPQQCSRCGGDRHQAGDKCSALHERHLLLEVPQEKEGHYSFTKGPASAHELSVDTAFLGATTTEKSASAWHTTISIGDREILFKLDRHRGRSDSHNGRFLQDSPRNGATEAIKGTLWSGSLSPRCARTVYSYAGISGTPQPKRTTLSKASGLICLASQPLLHFNSCTQSMRLKPTSGKSRKLRFRRAFQGLGNLGEEYSSRLTPFPMHALYTHRNVPIPLHEKAHDELNRMELMGVISKVNDPTSWCAGMMVVPKPSGAV